jgi:DNA-directed RNA polymerase subunit alpha
MTSLLLNLKQVRFKFLEGEENSARSRLEVRGEGVVTAGDIVCPPIVEVVNPETYLLTTDSPEADLEVEMTVSRGRGYSPAEERDKLPVSEIPADAVYSPVRKVSYKIERARIGQVSNFDRLVMEVWTDGTISPGEALSTASGILVKHFELIAEFSDIEIEVEPEEEESWIPDRVAEAGIEDLDLSVRAFNCLKRAGISNVGEILEKLDRDEEELLAIRNFGQKSLDELKEKLTAKGYWPLPIE